MQFYREPTGIKKALNRFRQYVNNYVHAVTGTFQELMYLVKLFLYKSIVRYSANISLSISVLSKQHSSLQCCTFLTHTRSYIIDNLECCQEITTAQIRTNIFSISQIHKRQNYQLFCLPHQFIIHSCPLPPL